MEKLFGNLEETFSRVSLLIKVLILRLVKSLVTLKLALLSKALISLLISLISKGADLFEAQSACEQRKLLRVILGDAVWQGGELRLSFRQPFEELRLSNSASTRKESTADGDAAVSDIWRRERDSNPR